MWFPRLSPSGLNVIGYDASAQHRLLIKRGDGPIEEFLRGHTRASWLDDERIVACVVDAPELCIWSMLEIDGCIEGVLEEVIELPAIAHDVHAEAGHWLAWCPSLGEHPWVYDGVIDAFATKEMATAPTENGTWIGPVGSVQARYRGGYGVCALHPAPPRCWPDEYVPWPNVTHFAVPVAHDLGWNPWIVRAEGEGANERVVAHPIGDPFGIIIWPFELGNSQVDARALDERFIRVVGTSKAGELLDVVLDLNAPRVDLQTPAPPVEVWEPAGDVVADVWPFIVGEPSAWPRWNGRDPASRMDCVRTVHPDGSESAQFVKFGDPTKWERWRLQGNGIWHEEDHINDHRGECYAFSDGRWLTRRMRVGDLIDAPSNLLRWWRSGRWTDWTPFPYRMTLLAYERERFSGRERIRFRYDPGGRQDTYEDYTCERGLGWTDWAEYSQRTDAQIGGGGPWSVPLEGPALTPSSGRVPVPAPPSPPLPRAPGVTIDAYDASIGVYPWHVAWHDRNTPGVGGMVELRPVGLGRVSVHVTLTNPAGRDTSGKDRMITLRV